MQTVLKPLQFFVNVIFFLLKDSKEILRVDITRSKLLLYSSFKVDIQGLFFFFPKGDIRQWSVSRKFQKPVSEFCSRVELSLGAAAKNVCVSLHVVWMKIDFCIQESYILSLTFSSNFMCGLMHSWTHPLFQNLWKLNNNTA